MQQASIVGRVRYVTLYIADKANKRLGTRQRLALIIEYSRAQVWGFAVNHL